MIVQWTYGNIYQPQHYQLRTIWTWSSGQAGAGDVAVTATYKPIFRPRRR